VLVPWAGTYHPTGYRLLGTTGTVPGTAIKCYDWQKRGKLNVFSLWLAFSFNHTTSNKYLKYILHKAINRNLLYVHPKYYSYLGATYDVQMRTRFETLRVALDIRRSFEQTS